MGVHGGDSILERFVFMFTDIIFIHQPGVMFTDFKMLLLPLIEQ